jgi:FdrA protein
MTISGIVKKGEYFDSVSLMIAAHKINQMEGVIDSAIMMGTPENKHILENSGFLIDAFKESLDSDLLIAVKAETAMIGESLLAQVDQELKNIRKTENTGETFAPRSLEGALKALPEANLSLISVAGKYAADEAMKALEKDLHVMIFSDNVSLEKEIALKKYALEKGLLVMGPDCGTAIINGVPLAFANVVKQGNIGIVAASGTGLQEVTTLISNNGGGISQAIGTGGRDVKKEVGGMMFMAALEALAQDDKTEAILLVSKPPDEEVLQKIGAKVKEIDKQVVAVFLGADAETLSSFGIIPAGDLASGAEKILACVGIQKDRVDLNLETLAMEIAAQLKPEQKYLRALFTGGTFCGETQVILKDLPDLYSNAPTAGSQRLDSAWRSFKHTVVDLGEDVFTVGRPHPMIDFSIRNERILTEAKNGETAVILLDLVLGYGANMSPMSELIPVLHEAKQLAQAKGRILPIICSVTGTDEDPQNMSGVIEALEGEGCIVCGSNAEASRLCKGIIGNR